MPLGMTTLQMTHPSAMAIKPPMGRVSQNDNAYLEHQHGRGVRPTPHQAATSNLGSPTRMVKAKASPSME